MNSPDSQTIVKRFFEMLRILKDAGELKSMSEFSRKHGIRHSTLQQSELEPESNRFQVAWLYYMAKDYGISAEYLLTGKDHESIRRLKAKAAKNRRLAST
jgi:hypothetical protein